jgi:antitoxin component YwqK of YwqJK toxin-antitoxin module
MKKLLFILLLTIPFVGFGQTEYEKDYYESGQLKDEGNKYWKDLGDGVRQSSQIGLWKYYFESGKLEKEGNWKDGEQDGLWKYYYESGKLETEGNYKDGEQDGLWKYYYESGKLKKKVNWKDGEQDGLSKYYYESGQLEQERNFIFSSSQEYRYQNFKHYYKNGKIKEEGSGLVGGDMDRLLIYRITWDENGNKTIHVDNRKQVGFPENW